VSSSSAHEPSGQRESVFAPMVPEQELPDQPGQPDEPD
jgi:hypothetical protein